MSSRTRLGWDPFFGNQCSPETIVARVVQAERDAWRVDGDVDSWVTIAGRLRHSAVTGAMLPAVGDWVEIEGERIHRGDEARDRRDTPGRGGVIVRVLPRRSVISRRAAGRASVEQVIAANVDTVFVVTSANEDLNERRLERYLAMIWESGATPVVVVNKSDLVVDPPTIETALRARLPFVDVAMVSALTDVGLTSPAAAWLQPGRTVALVGSSGVGKSTIVNRLAGADMQKVAAIRESDGTGRHTTTSRQLIVLPGGALLIDTPGMRELQPWSDAAIDTGFDDVSALAEGCRFADCQHAAEPGCAVRAAVEAGTLDADRLDNYRRLQREAAHAERRRDKGAAAEQKKRLKTMMRAQRALYRDRERLK